MSLIRSAHQLDDWLFWEGLRTAAFAMSRTWFERSTARASLTLLAHLWQVDLTILDCVPCLAVSISRGDGHLPSDAHGSC